jgi:4-amino-4-deoxy-L-arabinose transferase-like glycosyltransferase
MQDKKHILGLSPVALLIIICAAAKFAFHILTASNYGYFVDELYTIALSKHLAFGYVDLPPLVPALLALSRAIFGESLLGLHIVPALAGSATLVFVCLITKEFGGKLFAISLSALGFIIAPVWLALNSRFTYDGFDQLVLAVFLFVLVRYIRTGNKKLWITLGLVAGIACLTKMTILYLGPGFLVALLISKYRKDLLTPWPWLGFGLILLLVSPYLLWEYSNQWPTLEYWGNYHAKVLYDSSIPEYFINILLTMNAVLFPLLIIGLYRIFKRFDGTDYSYLGVLFLITLVFLYILRAKVYMLAELFMPLIAAGSIFVEEKLSGSGWKRGLKFAIIPYLLAGGILVAPAALPLLPPSLMTVYARDLGFLYKPIKNDRYLKTDFPQATAGRIGWDNLVQTVAGVYNSLPPEERKNCGIYAEWYGPAGAIDLLGPQYGLPHATSGFLNYWLWGPGEYHQGVEGCTIVITQNISQYYQMYEDVQQKAVVFNEHAMPYNTLFQVIVCRKPKLPVETLWPLLKDYYSK